MSVVVFGTLSPGIYAGNPGGRAAGLRGRLVYAEWPDEHDLSEMPVYFRGRPVPALSLERPAGGGGAVAWVGVARGDAQPVPGTGLVRVCVCVEGQCWLSPLQAEIYDRCTAYGRDRKNSGSNSAPLVVGDTVTLDRGHDGPVSLRAVIVQLHGPAFGATAWLEVVRASRGHDRGP